MVFKLRSDRFAMALSLLLAWDLHANELADADNLFSMPIEDLMNIKITSSTLQVESLKTVPSALSVYTRQQIRNLGFRSLEELINFVPGYQSSRTDDSSTARTYSSRGRRLGTGAREVLLLIDGKRLNTDFSGGPVGFNSLISLDNVERVEFIRGPGSSIYGSNAIMGVINVITKSQNEIAAEIGSSERLASFQWQIGDASRGLELFAKQGKDDGQSLAVCDADSPECNRVAPIKTLTDTRDPYQQREAYLKAHWGEVSATARYAQRSNSMFYADSGVNNDINFNESTSTFVQLAWDHPVNDHVSLQLSAFDSLIDNEAVEEYSRAPLIIADNSLKEKEAGGQMLAHFNYGKHRWLLGWELRKPQVFDGTTTPREPSPDPASYFVSSSTRTISGYFGQYQWGLSETTEMIFGLRWDHYSDFGGHASPRLGLIQQLDAKNSLKFLYSTSFRAPSVIETKILSGSVAGADLNPEVANNYEMVWQLEMDKGQLSTSLYRTEVQDAIHEAAANGGGQRTWLNGYESVSGIEVEWQQQWTTQWSTRVAATQIVDKALAISSEASTLLASSIEYQYGPWLSSLRAHFQGPRHDKTETDGNIQTVEFSPVAPHTLVDAHLSYKSSSAWELFAQGNNLFDKKYYSVAQRFAITSGVPERGRTFHGGVRWFF